MIEEVLDVALAATRVSGSSMRSMTSMNAISRNGNSNTRNPIMVLPLCPNKLAASSAPTAPMTKTARVQDAAKDRWQAGPAAERRLAGIPARPDPAGPPDQPGAGAALPARALRTGLPQPAGTVGGHHPVGPVHRQEGQRGDARRCSRKYPDAAAYAGAERAELEELIHQTGFFRAKTNTLMKLGQQLVERFDGQVPATLAELVTLPGFGRKTANVVLGNAFDIPGLTIDTHFLRLSGRWHWTANDDPVKVEADVAALIPRKEWTILSHRVIWHGRRMCHARRPACGVCPIAKLCPSAGIGEMNPVAAAKLVKSPSQLDPELTG